MIPRGSPTVGTWIHYHSLPTTGWFDCRVIGYPEKLTIYTTLIGLLNVKKYNIGGEVCDADV